jgi:imidazolonepropionase-like amidohydrolase
VYPGFISANSTLGLVEIEAVRATVDTAEVGPINPNVRAHTSINADSELINVARAGGVLTALSVPQAGGDGLIAGQSALLRLDGWNWEQMTIKAPIALHVYWPNSNIPDWLPKPIIEQAKKSAAENLMRVDEAFSAARAYDTAKRADKIRENDSRWDAMQNVFNNSLPVFIHANELTQIRQSLEFMRKQKLHWTLVGGLDAWRMAEELKRDGVAVILGSPYNSPDRRSEAYDVHYSAAAALQAAGIRFAMAGDASGMDTALEKNLPYLAAQAVAFGLDREVALRAITLSAAEILGVADKLGSLDAGKNATLFIADGDPLDIRTHIERAFIDGVEVDLSNKHTRLYERYQKKYGK